MNPPPDAPFSQPWHGRAFALTLALADAGHFTWPEWTEALSATLARHRATNGPRDGGEDYWRAWLETLETLLDAKHLSTPASRAALKAAWAGAYETTPHGQPVPPPRP